MNRNPRRTARTDRRPGSPRLFTSAVIATLGSLASGGTANAMPLPDPPGPHRAPHLAPQPAPPAGTTITHVIHAGAPLWMFLLVALASIALTALITVAVTRRTSHVASTQTGPQSAGLIRP